MDEPQNYPEGEEQPAPEPDLPADDDPEFLAELKAGEEEA